MSRDKQLALFPAGVTAHRPVTREHLLLARRAVRTVRARGSLRVADLATILGAEVGEAWLAVGVARRWGRVEVHDGVVALAVPREEGTA